MRRALLIMLGCMVVARGLAGDCLVVAGDQIRAGDLAGAHNSWSVVAADTVLGFAPVPGLRRTLRRDTLRAWAAKWGVAWEEEGELCVERPMRQVGKADFEQALEAALSASGVVGARFEVTDYSRYPAPPGEMIFPPAGLTPPPASRPDTPVLWRGYVRYGEGRRFGVWLRARVVVKQRRVVAKERIAVNQLISERDVRVMEVEAFPFGFAGAADPAEVVGKVARRSFGVGETIAPQLLQAPYAVKRGDLVRVEVQTGRAQIAVDAIAERAGRKGERIPLRNPSSGKVFEAVIAEAGKATIPQGGRL